MRIFNEDKTQELFEYDLTKGYLKDDELVTHIPEQQEVQEQFHYETIKTYPNCGKDVEKVIDIEGVPYIAEHDETENIQVYILYTERELFEIEAKNTILKLKQNLSNTDYVANKLSEEIATSFITGDNSSVIALRNKYFSILADRDAWREEINRLEEELNNGNNGQ